MAALAEVIPHPSSLKPVVLEEPKEIVALVLEDGTVRDVRLGGPVETCRRMSQGTVSGQDWILWWERRSF